MFLNKDIEIMETKIVIYEDANGEIKLDVSLENDTLWLSQKQLEFLFDRDKSVISRHIKNIFKEEELDKNSVVAKNATTESLSNSLSLKIFFKCLEITDLSLSKR